MIKTIQISFLLFMASIFQGLFVSAQTRPSEKQETLQQQKMKFFNENLQLTTAESARFWPIYNDYQNRRDKLTRDRNTMMQYYEVNMPNMTEAEATELINKYLAYHEEEAKLLEAYTGKFLEILPARKVMKIYLVELDFKKWLLENLRQNKAQTRPKE